MSYDISCFPVAPGEDPMQVYEALCERPEDEEASDPGPEREEHKRAIADALIRKNPELRPFEFQYDQIAASRGITVQQAKLRYRHIELDVPEDGNGIQMTVRDDSASVTVPYWHQGKQAERVFQEIWEYLRILADFGFACYDPQLDRVLKLKTDMPEALRCYADVVAKLKAVTSRGTPGRPWWKFWGRA